MKHCRQENERLTLAVLRDNFVSFLRYLSVLMARRRGGDYMAKTCHSVLRLLHFLKASAPQPYGAAKQRQFKEQESQLASLKHQLRKICRHVPFDYKALMEGAKWKDAPELIAFIEEEKKKAVELMKVGASLLHLAGAAVLVAVRAMYVRCTLCLPPSHPCGCLPLPPPSLAGPSRCNWGLPCHQHCHLHFLQVPRAAPVRDASRPPRCARRGRGLGQGPHALLLDGPSDTLEARVVHLPVPP
jgi:hypothetical protein